MKTNNRVLTIWAVLLLASLGSWVAQKSVIDYSFAFMDKWGLIIGYEIQFVPGSNTFLEDWQKEQLFSETKQIARTYGREIEFNDFYFKRDSIERRLADDIIEVMKKHQIQIEEVNIINLVVPKQIADAIAERARILKEPLPTRIKVDK